MKRTHRRVAMVAAFSLVEVLLAIVVLSLGLLGLGAVIPVVIRQQRIAGDLISGVSVGASAEAAIRGRLDLRTPQPTVSGPTIEPWRAWRDEDRPGGLFQNTLGNTTPSARRAGIWRVPAFDVSDGTLALAIDTTTVEFSNSTGGSADRFTFPLAQRLVPAPTPGGPPPRYVWDFVARRVVDRDSEGNPRYDDPALPETARDLVQIAVFVRPVDQSIRTRPGVSLAEAFTGVGTGVSDTDRRVPVSVTLDGVPQYNGRVGAGTGAYATPMVLRLDDALEYEDPLSPTLARTDDRNRLTFSTVGRAITQLPNQVPNYTSISGPGGVTTGAVDTSLARAVGLAGQINQQLVDAFGNIYRVIGRDGDQLIIDPPVPAWATTPADLIAVAFVPQPPADVRVFTLEVE